MKTNKNSKTTKNSIIEEHYNPIYDIYLVVANEHTTLEQLNKKYKFIEEDIDDEVLNGRATTSYPAVKRNTNAKVILVKLNAKKTKYTDKNPKLDFINTCSHEATHVMLDIFDYICQPIRFDNQEPVAYLQAWAMECIYKTLTKK